MLSTYGEKKQHYFVSAKKTTVFSLQRETNYHPTESNNQKIFAKHRNFSVSRKLSIRYQIKTTLNIR